MIRWRCHQKRRSQLYTYLDNMSFSWEHWYSHSSWV